MVKFQCCLKCSLSLFPLLKSLSSWFLWSHLKSQEMWSLEPSEYSPSETMAISQGFCDSTLLTQRDTWVPIAKSMGLVPGSSLHSLYHLLSIRVLIGYLIFWKLSRISFALRENLILPEFSFQFSLKTSQSTNTRNGKMKGPLYCLVSPFIFRHGHTLPQLYSTCVWWDRVCSYSWRPRGCLQLATHSPHWFVTTPAGLLSWSFKLLCWVLWHGFRIDTQGANGW